MATAALAGVIFFFLQPLPTLDTPGLFFSLLRRKLESQKKPMRGWTAEMGSKLKALAVLTEDPSSVPSLHTRRLLTAS